MLTVVDHPVAKMHVTALRDRTLGADQFRHHLLQLTRMMAYPVYRHLETEDWEVSTPLGENAVGQRVSRAPVLVPVLRAGLGMVPGFIDLIPGTMVSHLGTYRDHQTLEPRRYYTNFPKNSQERRFFVLDPMLATGGSAGDALSYLKAEGARHIVLVTVIAAAPGLERLFLEHPDVAIFTAAVDETLNSDGYILPGLGDAGDRQFGTLI